LDRKKRELGKDGKATAEVVSPPAFSECPDKTVVKTEELFRQGEDLYSLGMYQQAIHVWTRILFLERGDARAKTAIERAKRAVAERQRELDVELTAAAEALDGGDIEGAAGRVRQVLSIDPRHPEGHQLAETIASRKRRDETARTTGLSHAAQKVQKSPRVPEAVDVLDPSETLRSPRRGLLLRVSHGSPPTLGPRADASSLNIGLQMAGFVLAAILVFASGALYLHLNWESIVSDGAFANGANGVSGSAFGLGGVSPVAASAPSASELHYYNGVRLYAKGRYRQALGELGLVARDAAVFDRARSLILRIEERLLRGGELSDSSDEPVPFVR